MGYADQNCPKCHGTGLVSSGVGLCDCFTVNQLREYMGPILRYKKGRVAQAGLPELGDQNQGLVVSDENIGSLVVFANANWCEKDKKYSLLGVEELNAIGMKGTAQYKSLSDYAEAFPNFIVDMISVNPLRGPGYREKDEMVLLDFLRMMERRAEKRVIVLIGPTAGEFKREHPVLCRALAAMRFPYFDRGKYLAFAKNEAATESTEAKERVDD